MVFKRKRAGNELEKVRDWRNKSWSIVALNGEYVLMRGSEANLYHEKRVLPIYITPIGLKEKADFYAHIEFQIKAYEEGKV